MKLEPPTIEKGIPLPPKRKSVDSRYEEKIREMKVEDSFLVLTKHKHTATRCIENVFGKGSYASRTVDLEFTRVWRIK